MTADFPVRDAEVCFTPNGTPYFKECGVVCLAKPHVSLRGMEKFLKSFGPELAFGDYLADPVFLPPAEQLTKVAGQVCYMSLGSKRTMNDSASRYFQNMKSSGHGSVFEHPAFSFLFYGVSRSVIFEVVRHRAGFSYSQVSQRYVSGRVLRFVERPEYVNDPILEGMFIERIDRAAAEYGALAQELLDRQDAEISQILSAENKTDLRKKVQQAARSVLPNETEAPIVVSANVRAWRHFIEMRANEHAETEIRALAMKVFYCINDMAPILFEDYSIIKLPDGTEAVKTDYRKV